MAKEVLDQLDSSDGDEDQKNKIKHTKKSDIQVSDLKTNVFIVLFFTYVDTDLGRWQNHYGNPLS